jgi:hypothetical protein
MNDYRFNIQLHSTQDVVDFVNKCKLFYADVDVYDGAIMLDGKDLNSVFKISLGKTVRVYLLSDDIDAQYDFSNLLKEFIVEE